MIEPRSASYPVTAAARECGVTPALASTWWWLRRRADLGEIGFGALEAAQAAIVAEVGEQGFYRLRHRLWDAMLEARAYAPELLR